MRKPWNHIKPDHIKIASENHILIWGVEVEALSRATEINAVIIGSKCRLRPFQLTEFFNGPRQTLALRNQRSVIPWLWLFVQFAALLIIAIEAIINRDIVTKFSPLVHHLGAGQRKEKRVRHGQPVHRCGEGFRVI